VIKSLLVAWRDPAARRWHPVGRLTDANGTFEYVYVRGAESARRKSGFHPFESFPNIQDVYQSDELFPLFANRVPSAARSDYADFTTWLNVPTTERDPIVLLARSAGRRVTDNLELFPIPEADEHGECVFHFFAHGIRYATPQAQERILRFSAGDRLFMAHDFQNEVDCRALLLRTGDDEDGGRQFVGYCPSYLLDNVFELIARCEFAPEVSVEKVNPPPAPIQMRLLCKLSGCWPDGFTPFSGEAYQPIPAGAIV